MTNRQLETICRKEGIRLNPTGLSFPMKKDKTKDPRTLGQQAEALAQKIISEVPEGVCLFLVLARRNPIGEVGYVTSTTPSEAQSFMENMVASKVFLSDKK